MLAANRFCPAYRRAHVHVQDDRGGIPQPRDHKLKIWLARGITTARHVGSDTKKALALPRPAMWLFREWLSKAMLRTEVEQLKRAFIPGLLVSLAILAVTTLVGTVAGGLLAGVGRTLGVPAAVVRGEVGLHVGFYI